MLGFLSKMFGGSKSEKDITVIRPLVDQINKHFTAYQSLSNDQLRNKTQEFKSRIKAHLEKIDSQIASLNKQAEELPFSDIVGKDAIYQQVDALIKDRDKQIEEVLKEIHPEVLSKYYGCGSPIPPALEEMTVLDLGSGSGRDCFILSKLYHLLF